jgi:hypothetical protein
MLPRIPKRRLVPGAQISWPIATRPADGLTRCSQSAGRIVSPGSTERQNQVQKGTIGGRRSVDKKASKGHRVLYVVTVTNSINRFDLKDLPICNISGRTTWILLWHRISRKASRCQRGQSLWAAGAGHVRRGTGLRSRGWLHKTDRFGSPQLAIPMLETNSILGLDAISSL